MSFTHAMDRVAEGFEGLGAVILVVGFGFALVVAVRSWRRTGQAADGYQVLREFFGGTLLLALEVLVAADLIRTVAVAPTLDNVAVLGVIVLIRTFLSFSYGFAYGAGGTALRGKALQLVTSTGAPEAAYAADGHNRFTMEQLLAPLDATAHLTGMRLAEPLVLFGARMASDEDLALHAKTYREMLAGSELRAA